MVVCEFAIAVVCDGDWLEFASRKFRFSDVPRIGETIWIGESLQFEIADVQYGFVDDETPNVRIESQAHFPDWYRQNKQFLIEWGFSAIEGV